MKILVLLLVLEVVISTLGALTHLNKEKAPLVRLKKRPAGISSSSSSPAPKLIRNRTPEVADDGRSRNSADGGGDAKPIPKTPTPRIHTRERPFAPVGTTNRRRSRGATPLVSTTKAKRCPSSDILGSIHNPHASAVLSLTRRETMKARCERCRNGPLCKSLNACKACNVFCDHVGTEDLAPSGTQVEQNQENSVIPSANLMATQKRTEESTENQDPRIVTTTVSPSVQSVRSNSDKEDDLGPILQLRSSFGGDTKTSSEEQPLTIAEDGPTTVPNIPRKRLSMEERKRRRCEACRKGPLCNNALGCRVCRPVCDNIEITQILPLEDKKNPNAGYLGDLGQGKTVQGQADILGEEQPDSTTENDNVTTASGSEKPAKQPYIGDSDLETIQSQQRDDDVVFLKSRLLELPLKYPNMTERYYTVGSFDHGLGLLILLRMLNMSDHANVDKLIVVAKTPKQQLRQADEPDPDPNVFFVSNAFAQSRTSADSGIKNDTKSDSKTLDFADIFAMELDAAMAKKKKELKRNKLTRDETQAIIDGLWKELSSRPDETANTPEALTQDDSKNDTDVGCFLKGSAEEPTIVQPIIVQPPNYAIPPAPPLPLRSSTARPRPKILNPPVIQDSYLAKRGPKDDEEFDINDNEEAKLATLSNTVDSVTENLEKLTFSEENRVEAAPETFEDGGYAKKPLESDNQYQAANDDPKKTQHGSNSKVSLTPKKGSVRDRQNVDARTNDPEVGKRADQSYDPSASSRTDLANDVLQVVDDSLRIEPTSSRAAGDLEENVMDVVKDSLKIADHMPEKFQSRDVFGDPARVMSNQIGQRIKQIPKAVSNMMDEAQRMIERQEKIISGNELMDARNNIGEVKEPMEEQQPTVDRDSTSQVLAMPRTTDNTAQGVISGDLIPIKDTEAESIQNEKSEFPQFDRMMEKVIKGLDNGDKMISLNKIPDTRNNNDGAGQQVDQQNLNLAVSRPNPEMQAIALPQTTGNSPQASSDDLNPIRNSNAESRQNGERPSPLKDRTMEEAEKGMTGENQAPAARNNYVGAGQSKEEPSFAAAIQDPQTRIVALPQSTDESSDSERRMHADNLPEEFSYHSARPYSESQKLENRDSDGDLVNSRKLEVPVGPNSERNIDPDKTLPGLRSRGGSLISQNSGLTNNPDIGTDSAATTPDSRIVGVMVDTRYHTANLPDKFLYNRAKQFGDHEPLTDIEMDNVPREFNYDEAKNLELPFTSNFGGNIPDHSDSSSNTGKGDVVGSAVSDPLHADNLPESFDYQQARPLGDHKNSTNIHVSNLPQEFVYSEAKNFDLPFNSVLGEAAAGNNHQPQSTEVEENYTDFGQLVPAKDNQDVTNPDLNKVFFVGRNINFPLQMMKNKDGVYQLTVDMEKLCRCKKQNCTRRHQDSSEEHVVENDAPEVILGDQNHNMGMISPELPELQVKFAGENSEQPASRLQNIYRRKRSASNKSEESNANDLVKEHDAFNGTDESFDQLSKVDNHRKFQELEKKLEDTLISLDKDVTKYKEDNKELLNNSTTALLQNAKTGEDVMDAVSLVNSILDWMRALSIKRIFDELF